MFQYFKVVETPLIPIFKVKKKKKIPRKPNWKKKKIF